MKKMRQIHNPLNFFKTKSWEDHITENDHCTDAIHFDSVINDDIGKAKHVK